MTGTPAGATADRRVPSGEHDSPRPERRPHQDRRRLQPRQPERHQSVRTAQPREDRAQADREDHRRPRRGRSSGDLVRGRQGPGDAPGGVHAASRPRRAPRSGAQPVVRDPGPGPLHPRALDSRDDGRALRRIGSARPLDRARQGHHQDGPRAARHPDAGVRGARARRLRGAAARLSGHRQAQARGGLLRHPRLSERSRAARGRGAHLRNVRSGRAGRAVHRGARGQRRSARQQSRRTPAAGRAGLRRDGSDGLLLRGQDGQVGPHGRARLPGSRSARS